MAEHLPVLIEEVVASFERLESGALVVDGTCGFGGHSAAILSRYPELGLLGIDRDQTAVDAATERLEGFGVRANVQHGRFSKWAEQCRELELGAVSGLLLDIGVSSFQIDQATRGFSFQVEGPLDMRMNPDAGQSALEYLQGTSEVDLADVIWRYGDERFSRRIARQIKLALSERRLSTTLELAQICRRAYPRPKSGKHRIHPATRTFQAVRIAVNDELTELETALESVKTNFTSMGTVSVISFHSLEDRIVKNTFRDWQQQELGRIVKPAPITADETERQMNPRSRSAKLRVFHWGESVQEKKDRYRSKKHRN
ncbi:MAG: 16S rRNA (cytosine(1402)-N(4))-methyltransferase RsmH [Planctomycetes bacterium]|nr:16S rRNA (cytosine(1402)-N(4))-methyltransferase RsmH [Planctomycetota bacterium]